MSRVYVTGDCHADFHKFSTDCFPDQKELTKEDFVIVCGDFGGVWSDTNEERYWLNWLSRKRFTTLFVDGNHENFDRLNSDEFKVVDFHGGKAHQVRKNIFHLMRGNVYELCGKKFFAFGGASSHDIRDGILNPEDFEDFRELARTYNRLTSQGKLLRINHLSWWKEEMPSEEEMKFGLQTLKEHKNKVDFIVSHCCPQHIASVFSHGVYKPDELTSYFDKVAEKTKFSKWYFGHYHGDKAVSDKYIMLYHRIERIV